MYINTFKYTPEDVDCKLCTEYRKKTGCASCCCPWLAERIEAGVVGYGDAVREAFVSAPVLVTRLRFLVKTYPGELRDETHRQRMAVLQTRLGYRRRRDTQVFHAALYLLTANEDIYRRTADCFCKHGIEFGHARLRNISPHNYALLQAAIGIYGGKSGLALDDLANAEVVDTEAFQLIVNAFLIARFGTAAFQIKERGPAL